MPAARREGGSGRKQERTTQKAAAKVPPIRFRAPGEQKAALAQHMWGPQGAVMTLLPKAYLFCFPLPRPTPEEGKRGSNFVGRAEATFAFLRTLFGPCPFLGTPHGKSHRCRFCKRRKRSFRGGGRLCQPRSGRASGTAAGPGSKDSRSHSATINRHQT